MKTAIKLALEDLNGYRSFGEKIDIRFVCALLENVYLDLEKEQLKNAYTKGELNIITSKNIDSDSFFENTFEK